ncbi:hypothetical protein Hanom_Chr16g01474311 [Helianthus anomalus]
MLTPFIMRCHLARKLTSFVLNVLKSCTLCALALTQFDFLVKYDHVPCTRRHACLFTFPGVIV